MNKLKYLSKMLTQKQKEIYVQICQLKVYRAKGQFISTCKILMRLGLIIRDPKSSNVNDFVLNGKPLKISFTEKLPLKKELVETLTKKQTPALPIHKPIIWSTKPPTAEYSNTSREQHVSKWINAPVAVENKAYVKVRCLSDQQMEFIMANHVRYNAQELAEKISGNEISVKLFLQANVIDPLPRNRNKKTFYRHS